MSLFRIGFRTFFAIAILAQLAAPVLAANAKALNLFCPSHLSRTIETVSRAAHSGHSDAHAHHATRTETVSVVQDQGKENSGPRPFDLSCCSVHLSGVMPAVSEPVEGVLVKRQARIAGDAPSISSAAIDPPPRSLL